MPRCPASPPPLHARPNHRQLVRVQIIGSLQEHDTVLTFAERLADVIAGYERAPI
jgi:hypothetical protein